MSEEKPKRARKPVGPTKAASSEKEVTADKKKKPTKKVAAEQVAPDEASIAQALFGDESAASAPAEEAGAEVIGQEALPMAQQQGTQALVEAGFMTDDSIVAIKHSHKIFTGCNCISIDISRFTWYTYNSPTNE